MLDDRLGRHSVVVAALGLIPGVLVGVMLAVGIATPGVSYGRGVVVAMLSIPPISAFVLGWFNDRSLLRAVALAAAALLMIGVWYVLLILPAAFACSVARGSACM